MVAFSVIVKYLQGFVASSSTWAGGGNGHKNSDSIDGVLGRVSCPKLV